MYFRKQIRKDIESIRKRLVQLECPHDINNLIITQREIYTPIYGFGPYIIWEKYCHSCGKIIKIYPNESQGLKARNDLMRQLIKINENIINKVKER